MRRAGPIALLSGVILGLSTTAAWAAPANVTTTLDNRFSAASFNHEAGTLATITWTGGGPHNVRSYDSGPGGLPLFSSADVFLYPMSAPINGTEFLGPGDYPFLCGVHGVSMSSTLHVIGTAPGGSPGPAGSPTNVPAGRPSSRKKCKKGRVSKRGKCVRKKRKRKR